MACYTYPNELWCEIFSMFAMFSLKIIIIENFIIKNYIYIFFLLKKL